MNPRESVHAKARSILESKKQWANAFAGRVVYESGTWLITDKFEEMVSLEPVPGITAKLPPDGEYFLFDSFGSWMKRQIKLQGNELKELLDVWLDVVLADHEVYISPTKLKEVRDDLMEIHEKRLSKHMIPPELTPS